MASVVQAVGEVASRVAQLERTVACGPGQPYPGLSLKVEYTDSADTRKQGMGSLSQSVEALERYISPYIRQSLSEIYYFSFFLFKLSKTFESHSL